MSSLETTAFYRIRASVAAELGDYEIAAKDLRKAIELYPNPRGALAKRDIEMMTKRAAGYEQRAALLLA